jgi:hypothetical protein
MEGRINTLVDLIPQLTIPTEQLTPEAKKIYAEVLDKYEAEEN